ncbi:MAG: integrase, partial [Pseudomonadota bacterium]
MRKALSGQRYSATVVQNYCLYATAFLVYLERRNVALEAVTPVLVSTYLAHAVRRFRDRRGRAPSPRWTSIPRSAIHALLRNTLGTWPPGPPGPPVRSPEERLCWEICSDYERWLRSERGLAEASVAALMWEARNFCAWHLQQHGNADFVRLSPRDVDAYVDHRAPGLARKSLEGVAERLRGFLRHLHRSRRIATDLSPHVVAP